MTKLENALKEYAKCYTATKVFEISKDSIRDNILPFYEKQDEKVFKSKGLIIREASRKGRKFKKEVVEYLEDLGLLPFCVSLDKNLTKYFNLEKAKINRVDKLKLYAGGTKFIDRPEIYKEFNDDYETMNFEELTDCFKENYSKLKLSEAKLSSSKDDMLKAMKEEGVYSVKCEMGILKIEESFDLDINKIFDFVSGKKEMYAKRVGYSGPAANSYEILFLPEHKKATLPKTMRFANGKTLEEIIDGDRLSSSIYVKKGVFNKLEEKGYRGYAFEIELDPLEFFRKCKLSFGKVEELIDRGLIDPREMDTFIEKDEEKDVKYFEVMTEASSEKRREIFDQKLLNRAKKFDYSPSEPNIFEEIELESFSF